jgi:hypothetical protein
VFAVVDSSEEKASWLQELAKGCGVEISNEPASSESPDDTREESVLFSGWLQKMVILAPPPFWLVRPINNI